MQTSVDRSASVERASDNQTHQIVATLHGYVLKSFFGTSECHQGATFEVAEKDVGLPTARKRLSSLRSLQADGAVRCAKSPDRCLS